MQLTYRSPDYGAVPQAPSGAGPGSALAGAGAIAALNEVVERVTGRPVPMLRTVLVVGKHFGSRPWATRIVAATETLAPAMHIHTGRTTPASVALLAGRLRALGADVVVAVGGGSVLDLAKAGASMAGSDRCATGAVVAACERTAPLSPVRVVAVPTTPGSGAEMTPFATVWDVDRRRKLSLSGPGVAPSASVLDPDLLASLTPAGLLSCVLDTVCQGAEAAWSARATHTSTAAGLAAIELAAPVLARVGQPLTVVDRLTLQLAGNAGGRAIAAANTTSCHAISYPLTLRLGLAHGHACAVSFGRMLRYNAETVAADCVDPRGPQRVHEVIARIACALGAPDAPTAAAWTEALLERHGLTRFDDLPIDHHAVATDALRYPRCHDNPRRLDPALLTRLLGRPDGGEDP
jgi:alcohol dehydrogenase class IV